MPSFPRTLSNLSARGRSKKKKKWEDFDDGDSLTTFPTENPPKYNREAVKIYRAKAKELTTEYGSDAVAYSDDDDDDDERRFDERDSIPVVRRSSSFRGLRQKFEKISLSAIQRQRDLVPGTQPSMHESRCAAQPEQDLHVRFVDKPETPREAIAPVEYVEIKQRHKTRGIVPKATVPVAPPQKQVSLTLDQQDELLASMLASGCVFTEGELQSHMLMNHVAYNLDSMTKSMSKSQQGRVARDTATKTHRESRGGESNDFLGVVSNEMKSAYSKIPKDRDELVIFLGEELESATCGRPQLPQDGGVYTYDFDGSTVIKNGATTRRLVAIKEGGTVEDMLESIEMGYEASLVGCGGPPKLK